MCQGYFVHFVEARALPSFSRRGRCPHRPAGLDCESASAKHTCPSLPLRRGGAKRRRGWGCDGVTGLSQAPHPPREAADAARADEGIGPYGKIVPWYVRRRHSDVAAKRTRDARYLRRKWEIHGQKLPCVTFNLCSGAAGAAFVKSSVAVTAIRFHWPARSQEGAGSMRRDGPVERNGLRDASPGDARRAAPTGVRGPQPPARFRHFSAVKSAPPEAAPAHGCGNETRLRRVRADVGIGPYTSTKLPFPP